MAKQNNKNVILALGVLALLFFMGCQTTQTPVPPSPPPQVTDVPQPLIGQAISLEQYNAFLNDAPLLPFAPPFIEDYEHSFFTVQDSYPVTEEGNVKVALDVTKPTSDDNNWMFFHKGYYYTNTRTWVMFDLEGEKLGESLRGKQWIVNEASATPSIPLDVLRTAVENYIVVYACRQEFTGEGAEREAKYKCLHRRVDLRHDPGLWSIQSFTVDYPVCSIQEDCGEGMKCSSEGSTAGHCVLFEPECAQNSDCEGGEVCDADGQCVLEPVTEPGEVAFLDWNCVTDADCGVGNACTTEGTIGPTGDSIPAGVCICDTSSCSAEGRSCIGFNDGKIPLCGDTCADASACSDGLACVDNAFCGCTIDAQCGEGYYCQLEDTDGAGGVCMQSTCGPEDICFDGRTCVAEQCVAEPASEICTGNRDCEEGSLCVIDSECKEGLICGSSNTCEQDANFCTKDTDCGGDKICFGNQCSNNDCISFPASLRSWMKFDGNLKDEVMNTVSDPNGLVEFVNNDELFLQGDDNTFVEINNPEQLFSDIKDGFTLELSLRLSTIQRNQGIIGTDSYLGPSNDPLFGPLTLTYQKDDPNTPRDEEGISLRLLSGSEEVFITVHDINPSQKYNILATFDGATASLFAKADGESLKFATGSFSQPVQLNKLENPIQIGRYYGESSGNNRVFFGRIDNLRWYSDAFAEEDVGKLFAGFMSFCDELPGTLPDDGTPDMTCTSNFQCGPGMVCINLRCVTDTRPITPCTTNLECGAGKICEKGSCVVLDASECTSDEECSLGQVCKNNVCVASSVPPVGCSATQDISLGSPATFDLGSKEGYIVTYKSYSLLTPLLPEKAVFAIRPSNRVPNPLVGDIDITLSEKGSATVPLLARVELEREDVITLERLYPKTATLVLDACSS